MGMSVQEKEGRTQVTIREIAKEAGVSLGTVSHVLNRTASVSEEKSRAVLEAVKKLGYKPNQAARMLKNKNSKTIGLLLPDIGNPFYAELARGAEDMANSHEYTVLVCNNDRNPEKEERYLSTLANKQVDGIIVVKLANSVEKLKQYFAPKQIVLIDSEELPCERENSQIQMVNLNEREGASIAMNYLYHNGHRNIAHIAGLLESNSSRERKREYCDFMKRIGVSEEQLVIENGTYSYYGGYQAMKTILNRNPEVTGVFAANDLMGMGAMQAIQDSGRRVPEDISVIGYDDIEPTEYCTPKLTTIRQPKYEMGQYGMALALKALGEDQVTLPLLPRNFLIVRQSVQRKR
ncbi:LacI family DNA-binding transcriptional regulator [Lacrimispora sp. 210928-DFI.3.58]|uniref:LacI family DNA-binding transcriptional regulator n=1 Tax=Lacrimispora sp. 210928-DFI.3.58 TaxID=2883214 RepID=UPI001D0697C0|nr:LacI family DNA-binding transcriptional regulator [Lacrimispora sp. 210928-DFI.3.58]MCB7318535.1 LacI family transcriptional regulator [Lacrimispora sp. 210928-DFI.3.58]